MTSGEVETGGTSHRFEPLPFGGWSNGVKREQAWRIEATGEHTFFKFVFEEIIKELRDTSFRVARNRPAWSIVPRMRSSAAGAG